MGNLVNHIHDSGYKYLFSHSGFVKQLLENFIDMQWVKEIDFSKLEKVNTSFIRKNYKNKESDVIYKLSYKNKTAYLYLLIEFQSRVDKTMALRIQSYVNDFYEDLIKKDTQKEKYPVIFPVVIYNGDKKWDAVDNIVDMIEIFSDELRPYIPSLKYFKIIINEFDKKALLKIRNTLASIFLIENLKEDELEKYSRELANIVAEEIDINIKNAFINWFLRLVDDDRINNSTNNVKSITHEEVKTMFSTTLEKIKIKERNEGKLEGLEKGIEKGIKKGIEKGKIEAAKGMKKEGFNFDVISRITGLRMEEIEKL